MNKLTKQATVDEQHLFEDISTLIKVAQQEALHQLSKMNVLLYWHIGKKINIAILNEKRAEYGANILSSVAKKLQVIYGQGFGRRILERCIQFTRVYPQGTGVRAPDCSKRQRLLLTLYQQALYTSDK